MPESEEAWDVVIRWDVEDGGLLGAIIQCDACDGGGNVPMTRETCPVCDGDRELHRAYVHDGRMVAVVGGGLGLDHAAAPQEPEPG